MKESQFRLFVIRPVLEDMGLWSEAAENLLLGTAVHESAGLEFIDQITSSRDTTWGPAYGFYQIEAATHDDVWRYLKTRPNLAAKVHPYAATTPARLIQLATNLCYATAIARIKYWMVPEALPVPGDIEGMARYWKRYWNTSKGKGTAEQFMANYERYVL